MSGKRTVKFEITPSLHDVMTSKQSNDVNGRHSPDDSSTDEDDDDCSASQTQSRFRVVAAPERVNGGGEGGGSGGGEGGGRRSSISANGDRRSSRSSGDDPSGFSRRPTLFSDPSNPYDTHLTFGSNTLETLPHLDHYRNLFTQSAGTGARARPTLQELHEQELQDELDEILQEDSRKVTEKQVSEEAKAAQTVEKFGWIKGVLIRCLLNIFGVMLFLRLSWVTGQAGIALTSVIVLLATAVTTLTALSMSAICTNGEVKGGGAYYMISRSLGPEFGGPIGIIFSVANAVAAAMYIVGFAETISDLLKVYNCSFFENPVNEVRVIGLGTAIIILGVALAGMSWEARAQLVLLAILLLALGNFIVGSFIPPSKVLRDKGFHGYSGSIFVENLLPDFREEHSFFSVFAIFFPAATGILAGANISGDLKDAQSAIPKGTLLAILLTSVTYLAIAWMAGACVVRDSPLFIFDQLLSNLTATTNSSSPVIDSWTTSSELLFYNPYNNTTDMSNSTDSSITEYCAVGNCSYGLMNDMQVIQMVSAFGPITIAGIFSATLSSALASMVSAPKVFQAVCKDRIFPYIHVFAVGYGKNNEPRRAYLLAFILGCACICIGELNAIAPLISNFFLMSYALVNYSCVDSSFAKSPGWRPAFRYYSVWLSLLGALLCVAVMFVINWATALLTIALVAILYFYVHYTKPDINWGSSTQAHVYRNALIHTQKLVTVVEHVKNYRPQILALTGMPIERPAMVDFCTSITKNVSLMICGHVLLSETAENLNDIPFFNRLAYRWLTKRKAKSFYTVVTSSSLRLGVRSMLQSVGIGKLKPNTLFLGFKTDWRTAQPEQLEEYVNILHDAFDLRYSVGILRLKEGLHMISDIKQVITEVDLSPVTPDIHLLSPSGESNTTTELLLSPNVGGGGGGGDGGGGGNGIASKRVIPPSPCRDFIRRNNSSMNLSNSSNSATTRGLLNVPSVRSFDEEDGRASPYPMSGEEEGEGEGEGEGVCGGGRGRARDLEDRMTEENDEGANRFSRRQKRGFIDVWWLFDDGGLTLLVPYLMTTKKYWSNCKLRVFMAGSKRNEMSREQRHLATLLHKFRIQYSSITVITDISKRPSSENISEFLELISDWQLKPSLGETEETHPWKIPDSQLMTQKPKTYRHLRLRELLQEHSSEARLIVMTLPMPRKGVCASSLYMAWIDILTKNMPPILLLRGNQENVLTYYS